ncbi:MAG: hypothetical protein A2958_01025 [Candidatus Levybacteria bacterium RIFCSPLOWO2_01_FULL_38_13]|nr:MAG: hypothetical protein A2629_00920 [Candidatus Levybacteria bacterium RIFCSPHIGHO2_01_FULL_41_15]OGH34870.1 MAG: hypothetical protein A2958_01025 [Candidatus Levybacteria bacterium RIFCSPLOWO2_01_FULL_38_13]
MKALHMVTFTLTIIGALNWGLVGLLNLDVVALILGAGSGLTKLVYVLVGLSAVYIAATHMKDCKICSAK